MITSKDALRLGPVARIQAVASACHGGGIEAGALGLNYYLGCNDVEVGSVLLVPTYRLEEVEETIEPEEPGVPVEPYVGMVIPYGNDKGHYVVFGKNLSGGWHIVCFSAECDQLDVDLYYYPKEAIYEWPSTPPTPAVTRKVKKWVRIPQVEGSAEK